MVTLFYLVYGIIVLHVHVKMGWESIRMTYWRRNTKTQINYLPLITKSTWW